MRRLLCTVLVLLSTPLFAEVVAAKTCPPSFGHSGYIPPAQWKFVPEWKSGTEPLQSPIDIAQPFTSERDKAITVSYSSMPVTVKNSGHDFRVIPSGDNTISVVVDDKTIKATLASFTSTPLPSTRSTARRRWPERCTSYTPSRERTSLRDRGAAHAHGTGGVGRAERRWARGGIERARGVDARGVDVGGAGGDGGVGEAGRAVVARNVRSALSICVRRAATCAKATTTCRACRTSLDKRSHTARQRAWSPHMPSLHHTRGRKARGPSLALAVRNV